MKLDDLMDGLAFEKRLKVKEARREPTGDTMAMAMYGLIEEQAPVSLAKNKGLCLEIDQAEANRHYQRR